jgi:cell division septation protein DedD
MAEDLAAEQERAQEAAEWSLVAKSTDAEVIKAFLKRWPNGKHVKAAQARIAELRLGIGRLRLSTLLGISILLGTGAIGAVALALVALAWLPARQSSVPGPSPSRAREKLNAAERAAAEKAAAEQAAIQRGAANKPKKVKTVTIRPEGGEPADAAPAPAAAASRAAVPGTPAPARTARPAAPTSSGSEPQATAPRAAPARSQTALAVPPPRPSGGNYVVQLSAQKTQEDAQASFRAMQAKYPSVLSGRQPIIRRKEQPGKGVYFGAQVGPFASREEATQLCEELKAAGGSCFVQRN